MVRTREHPPDPDPHSRDQAAIQVTLILQQGNREIPALHPADVKWLSGRLNHHSLGISLLHMGRKLTVLKMCSLNPKLCCFPSSYLKTKYMQGVSSCPPQKIPSKVNQEPLVQVSVG